MSKKVGIILLNWNGLEDTIECLHSVSKLTYNNFCIIVVDNHSDISPNKITEVFPDVILIKNKKNDGFAKGNNIGIKKSWDLGCDYTWILNNDTTVAPTALNELVKELDYDTNIGAVTNLILYYDDKSLAWFSGGIINNGIPSHKGYFKKIEQNKLSSDTDYLSGCSFLARTSILNKIKGFDENYFCYCEDIDISLRIKQLGYALAFSKSAVIWHKVSKSAGTHLSPLKTYYKHRNMIYFLKKFNYPKIIIIKWYLTSIKYFFSLIVKHRSANTAISLLMALFDAAIQKMGKKDFN